MKIIVEITATTEELTEGLNRLFQDDIDFREHVLTAIRRTVRAETGIASGVALTRIIVEAELVNEVGPDDPPDAASIKARWG